jgi:hypothetical protein
MGIWTNHKQGDLLNEAQGEALTAARDKERAINGGRPDKALIEELKKKETKKKAKDVAPTKPKEKVGPRPKAEVKAETKREPPPVQGVSKKSNTALLNFMGEPRKIPKPQWKRKAWLAGGGTLAAGIGYKTYEHYKDPLEKD